MQLLLPPGQGPGRRVHQGRRQAAGLGARALGVRDLRQLHLLPRAAGQGVPLELERARPLVLDPVRGLRGGGVVRAVLPPPDERLGVLLPRGALRRVVAALRERVLPGHAVGQERDDPLPAGARPQHAPRGGHAARDLRRGRRHDALLDDGRAPRGGVDRRRAVGRAHRRRAPLARGHRLHAAGRPLRRGVGGVRRRQAFARRLLAPRLGERDVLGDLRLRGVPQPPELRHRPDLHPALRGGEVRPRGGEVDVLGGDALPARLPRVRGDRDASLGVGEVPSRRGASGGACEVRCGLPVVHHPPAADRRVGAAGGGDHRRGDVHRLLDAQLRGDGAPGGLRQALFRAGRGARARRWSS